MSALHTLTDVHGFVSLKMCVYSHHPLKSQGIFFFIISFVFITGSFSKTTAGATCLITAHMTKGGETQI